MVSTTTLSTESSYPTGSDSSTGEPTTSIPSCLDQWFNADGADSYDVCPEHSLYTGDCCLDQYFIIAIAAGGGALIIVVLISVVIWLCEERKKYRHHLVDEEANMVSVDGINNPAVTDIERKHGKQTGNKTESLPGHPTSTVHSHAGIQPEAEEIRRESNRKQNNQPPGDVYLNEQDLDRQMAPQMRDKLPTSSLPRYESQLYDDIGPLQEQRSNANKQPSEDQHEYYNTPEIWQDHAQLNGKDKATIPDKGEGRQQHLEDEAVKKLETRANVADIDLAQFADFEPKLDHVDPKADYTIKRPQYEICLDEMM